MSFFAGPQYLASSDRAWYQKIRLVLYALALVLLVVFLLNVTFPHIIFAFDFNNPEAHSNQLFQPLDEHFQNIQKGKVAPSGTLGIFGSLSSPVSRVDVSYQPSQSDHSDYSGLEANFVRGYAAAFSPIGAPITGFDQADNLFVSNGNYYLRDGSTLRPFISEAAFLSRYPKELAQPVSQGFLAQYTVASEEIGFRPGTLVAYADGVFIVTKDNTIRPFGSPEIFLGYGYSFQNVHYVDAEELGIYERGRIIQFGGSHEEGTLFRDTATATYFLYQDNSLRPVQNEAVLDHLKGEQAPVPFSSVAQKQTVSCALSKRWLSRQYQCGVSTDSFSGSGSDYRVVLLNDGKERDIANMKLGLQVSRKKENVMASVREFELRILQRVGL